LLTVLAGGPSNRRAYRARAAAAVPLTNQLRKMTRHNPIRAIENPLDRARAGCGEN
jgi:hypothetical protein